MVKSTAKRKTAKVRSGDTLSSLAQRHNVKGGWQRLWKLNKGKLSSPHMVRIGQSLRIS